MRKNFAPFFTGVSSDLIWRQLVEVEYGIPIRACLNYEKSAYSYPEKGLFIQKLTRHIIKKGKKEYVFYERNQLQTIRSIRGLLGKKDCNSKK